MSTSVPTTPGNENSSHSTRRRAPSNFYFSLGPSASIAGNSPGALNGPDAVRRPSYREAVAQVHEAVYQRCSAGHREHLRDATRQCYDSAAVFENPVTTVIGRDSILDHFALTALIPGTLYSEIQDVCESQDLTGNHCVLLTHLVTVNLSLNPYSWWSSAHPTEARARRLTSSCASWNDFYHGYGWESGWNSHATTPAAGMTPALLPFDMTDLQAGNDYPQPHRRDFASTYSAQASIFNLSSLSPHRIYSELTTLQIKLLTRLEFNENNMIIRHEDSYDMKAVLESLPFFGTVYGVNRRLIGWGLSKASRVLLGRREDTRKEEHKRATFRSPLFDMEHDSPALPGPSSARSPVLITKPTQDDGIPRTPPSPSGRLLQSTSALLAGAVSTGPASQSDTSFPSSDPHTLDHASMHTPAPSTQADSSSSSKLRTTLTGGPFRLKSQVARPVVSHNAQSFERRLRGASDEDFSALNQPGVDPDHT